MPCRFCQSSQVRKISEMEIEEGIEEFFACLRCGKVTARVKLNQSSLPEEESVEEVETVAVASSVKPEEPIIKVKPETAKMTGKGFTEEVDENATSGNEGGMLRQLPLQPEKDKGKGQVQEN